MKNIEEDNSNTTFSSSCGHLLIISISIGISMMAIYAGRLPWIEWSVSDIILGQRTRYTDVFWMLPKYRTGVFTDVGALKNHGYFALTVGWTARLIIASILITSIWLTIKHTGERWLLIVSLLLLSPFICFFICELSWVHLWLIDTVWLSEHESLPKIIRIDWKGPFLLASSFLIQMILVIVVRINKKI